MVLSSISHHLGALHHHKQHSVLTVHASYNRFEMKSIATVAIGNIALIKAITAKIARHAVAARKSLIGSLKID